MRGLSYYLTVKRIGFIDKDAFCLNRIILLDYVCDTHTFNKVYN